MILFRLKWESVQRKILNNTIGCTPTWQISKGNMQMAIIWDSEIKHVVKVYLWVGFLDPRVYFFYINRLIDYDHSHWLLFLKDLFSHSSFKKLFAIECMAAMNEIRKKQCNYNSTR